MCSRGGGGGKVSYTSHVDFSVISVMCCLYFVFNVQDPKCSLHIHGLLAINGGSASGVMGPLSVPHAHGLILAHGECVCLVWRMPICVVLLLYFFVLCCYFNCCGAAKYYI